MWVFKEKMDLRLKKELIKLGSKNDANVCKSKFRADRKKNYGASKIIGNGQRSQARCNQLRTIGTTASEESEGVYKK